MSQENVEVVRQGCDALNAFMRGDLSSEALSELLDPQFEFHWHDERTLPDQPQHLRRAEFVGFWEQMRSALNEFVTEPLEVIEGPGDRVLVSIRESGRGRESGIPFVVHFFQVWTFRDGHLRNVELFRHRADALEAAALRE